MAKGGRQPGAGRPKGAISKVSAAEARAAAESGLLPHEWLLKVSRGEGIEHTRWNITRDEDGNEISRELVSEIVYAEFPIRIDAAKAASPFYAAKLTAQAISITGTDAVAQTLKHIAEKLPVLLVC